MELKKIIQRNYIFFRVVVIMLQTILFFYAFYFADKKASFNTLSQNKSDPMLYTCILISLGGSLFIYYMLGGFRQRTEQNL